MLWDWLTKKLRVTHVLSIDTYTYFSNTSSCVDNNLKLLINDGKQNYKNRLILRKDNKRNDYTKEWPSADFMFP